MFIVPAKPEVITFHGDKQGVHEVNYTYCMSISGADDLIEVLVDAGWKRTHLSCGHVPKESGRYSSRITTFYLWVVTAWHMGIPQK